jgi:hypothetical protein
MPVSQVLECFNCQAPITAEVESTDTVVICPVCKSPNGPGASKNFIDPFYVSEQFNRINSIVKFNEFFMARDPKKIQACGEEFMMMISNIIKKPMSDQMFQEIVSVGRKIGKMSEGVHAYIMAENTRAASIKEMEDADKENTKSRENEQPGE